MDTRSSLAAGGRLRGRRHHERGQQTSTEPRRPRVRRVTAPTATPRPSGRSTRRAASTTPIQRRSRRTGRSSAPSRRRPSRMCRRDRGRLGAEGTRVRTRRSTACSRSTATTPPRSWSRERRRSRRRSKHLPTSQAAQDRIHLYESEVCGAQQPEPADVSYAEEEPGPYCGLAMAAGRAGGRGARRVATRRRSRPCSTPSRRAAAALTEAAPAVIKADVIELVAWDTGRNVEVAERHGYDCSAAITEGTRAGPLRPQLQRRGDPRASTPGCSPTKSRCAVRELERWLGLVGPSAQVAEGHRSPAEGLVGQPGAPVA